MKVSRIAMLASGILALAGAALAEGQLVVAGYGGNSAENSMTYLYEPFSAETGIQVEQVIVPGQMVAGMTAQQESGNVQWDIVRGLAAGDFANMRAQGFFAELPEEVRAAVSENYPLVDDFGVGDKRGVLFIVCNTLTAERCPTTAAEFVDIENFPGERFMPSFQTLEAFTFAAYASGVPADEVYPIDVDRAIEVLDRIRPTIVQFYSSSTTARQLLASGEVQMGLLWSGVPTELRREQNTSIDLAWSWDGAVTYPQWTAVFKDSPNPESAWAFIQWLNDNPERLAEFTNIEVGDTDHRVAATMLTEDVRELSAAVERDVPQLPINLEWYMGNPDIRARIEDYWKNYIN